jgi:3-phosphoshikimate 1-carboxyvinyltransferase
MLKGTISLPGDKSVSHRALLLGALAHGETPVENFLPGQDCLSTLGCLRALGAEVEVKSPTELVIHGSGPEGLKEAAGVLDCGNSGTTARLLLGILAGLPFPSRVSGDESLRRRPMGRVVEPLRSMGAEIQGEGDGRFLPLRVLGRPLRGLSYRLPVASAQVKSALLLAGLVSGEAVEVEEPALSRDHTEKLLAYLGARVERQGRWVRLGPGQRLEGKPVRVPGDLSSAAFFLVAASIVPGSEVLLRNVGVNPTRAGALEVLERMGAQITRLSRGEAGGEPVADLLVRAAPLQAVEVRGDIIPTLIDEIPILAVAALFARGTTVIRDAAELRVKETDRIKAVVTELRKMGAAVSEEPDGLTVTGGRPLEGGRLQSYGDHRMAMALEVAGLAAGRDVELDDRACVGVSFPNLYNLLQELRA